MNSVALNVAVRNYDFVAPLALGDVETPGIDISLTRTPDAIGQFLSNPAIDAGEHSFSRYVVDLANGDRTFVGMPVFLTRNFSHRCFFVRRGSDLKQLKDLVGKRVGTNMWLATGNTWSRSVLREAGVRLEEVHWVVGRLDPTAKISPEDSIPAHARREDEKYLVDMLKNGEIDALMCPLPPAGFNGSHGEIVRMYPDFRDQERSYFRRVNYHPCHHILAMRRTVFEQNPSSIGRLYQAFDSSRRQAEAWRRRYAETTPWLLAELEEVTELMGDRFQAYGTGDNMIMIQALCDELYEQGLIANRMDPSQVFEDFEAYFS